MKRSLFIIITLILMVTFLLKKYLGDNLRKSIYRSLNNSELVLGSKLRLWKEHFGNPSTIKQKDEGTTYFYWPKQGVAVFTHPLYKSQYKNRSKDDFIVTSILVPFKKEITPLIITSKEKKKLTFTTLRSLNIKDKVITKDNLQFIKSFYLFNKEIGSNVELNHFPLTFLPLPRARVYLDGNAIQAIEIIMTTGFWDFD